MIHDGARVESGTGSSTGDGYSICHEKSSILSIRCKRIVSPAVRNRRCGRHVLLFNGVQPLMSVAKHNHDSLYII